MNIETLSKEWVKATESRNRNSEELPEAIEYVLNLNSTEKSEELWSFIKHTYKENISENVISNLAAGPLEDLLGYYGERYINEVEELARKDPKFKELQGGVWQHLMPSTIWEREYAKPEEQNGKKANK